jgi:hypothetical protein
MGFLDKAKAAAESAAEKAKEVAEQATAKAKEGVDDVQTKRALGNAYETLGHTAYELAKAGEISHPKLTGTIDEITRLQAHLADENQAPTDGAATAPAAETAPPEVAAPAEPDPAPASQAPTP